MYSENTDPNAKKTITNHRVIFTEISNLSVLITVLYFIFTGRYWANISDTVLTGTFRQWSEGSLNVNVYKPGDTIPHIWGEATAVNFAAGTWMVEYGRGFIPSTMGFALADTLFSTQDFLTMFYAFRIYIKAMVQEAGFYISSISSR